MHSFTTLIRHCAYSTLGTLDETERCIIEQLESSAATPLVIALRVVRFQKAAFAVGIFSMFDAHIQDAFGCDNGFKKAAQILYDKAEYKLKERFEYFQCAINVLKHGRGRSYDQLIVKSDTLPFKVKQPNEHYFDEGDVSEIQTQIEVDDVFVNNCVEVICEVSAVLYKK
jgi:hypothetical protein